jgi:type IV pilus assembly protein PilY1
VISERTWLLAALFVSLWPRAAASQVATCSEDARIPQPVLVDYGGPANESEPRNVVLFQGTADGALRALDVQGRELWKFTPPGISASDGEGDLMTELRVLRFDADNDGRIDPASGDHVWLYFGMRQGGRFYHAIDATDRTRIRSLWSVGPDELPGVGETWSPPNIARVRIAGAAQNAELFVVIVGGGFDPGLAANRIYMLDAASGHLLWDAGGSESPTRVDLPLTSMTHGVAARVVVLDTDGDRLSDRLYTVDVAGRIWRFDIWNDHDRSALVTGGVLAILSTVSTGDTASADSRRFYSAPDIALVQPRGAAAYFNLAIGSGDRNAPSGTGTHDRFYAIRDRNPFVRLNQAEFDSLRPITERDLVDVTASLAAATVAPSAAGWMIDLRLHGGWVGEKVLAEATTLNGTVLFTTHTPSARDVIDPCAAEGANRAYALRIDSGWPALDLDDDHAITQSDAARDLAHGGLPGAVSVVLGPETRTSDAAAQDAGLASSEFRCLVDGEPLPRCPTARHLVRTFWEHPSVN